MIKTRQLMKAARDMNAPLWFNMYENGSKRLPLTKRQAYATKAEAVGKAKALSFVPNGVVYRIKVTFK